MPMPARASLALLLAVLLALSAGCSMNQLVVRTSAVLLDGGIESMNRETDPQLARAAIPAQLKLLEGMILEDPGNEKLRAYAAQALYGYAFGFVEHEDADRAAALYRRGLTHGLAALRAAGVEEDLRAARPAEVQFAVSLLGERHLPALFWTASCWAKWVDLNRDDPSGVADLASAAALMERVLELDDNYYHGGPHLFFGVYYGGRSPMLGGDFARAEEHFAAARSATEGRLLMIDVLYAEYFARQRLDREAFHERLTRVLEAPDDLMPEMALANALAKARARRLLAKEDAWF